MRFLIDNSLSPRLAVELGHRGHDAAHVRDLGLVSAADPIVFDWAASESRILVAQDTDFATILAQTGSPLPLVILFRTRQKSTTFVAGTLLAQLPDIAEALQTGAIVVIEDTRMRIRSLPLS